MWGPSSAETTCLRHSDVLRSVCLHNSNRTRFLTPVGPRNRVSHQKCWIKPCGFEFISADVADRDGPVGAGGEVSRNRWQTLWNRQRFFWAVTRVGFSSEKTERRSYKVTNRHRPSCDCPVPLSWWPFYSAVHSSSSDKWVSL